MAWTIVLPFRLASVRTSSACDGCNTCCSTKISATCLSFIGALKIRTVEEPNRRSSAHISQRGGNDFLRGRDPGQNFTDSVLAKRAHAEFARPLPQIQGRAALVDHVADFVIENKDFENAHPSFVAGAAAFFAAFSEHHLRVG